MNPVWQIQINESQTETVSSKKSSCQLDQSLTASNLTWKPFKTVALTEKGKLLNQKVSQHSISFPLLKHSASTEEAQ